MNELERYINKEKQKKWLELFMILTEFNKKENIISFTYNEEVLMIQTGVNDFCRISLKHKGGKNKEKMKNVVCECLNQIIDLEKKLEESQNNLKKVIDYLNQKNIHITLKDEQLSSELDEKIGENENEGNNL